MDPAAYEASGITFDYGGGAVLHHADLALPAGVVGALLGPNGSGKSTLLKVLLGRYRPASGEVRLFGRALAKLPASERARTVGYLPQEVQAAYDLSVLEVVLLGRYPHRPFGLESRRDLDLAHDCLARTRTEPLATRRFGTLSGGEKQRVLLASVLAQEPRVVLLDEPTAALDVHHQHEVMELLCALRDQGLSVLAVTHDLNLASRYADQVWLLHGGRIVASGTPRHVLTADVLVNVYGERLRVLPDPETGDPLVLPPARAVSP